MRGWALIKFSPFSASLICNKIIKYIMVATKSEDVTKVSVKYSEENSVFASGGSLLSLIGVCVGGSGVGVGAYSRPGAY